MTIDARKKKKKGCCQQIIIIIRLIMIIIIIISNKSHTLMISPQPVLAYLLSLLASQDK